MLALRDLWLTRNGEVLFRGVSLEIFPGQHVGLVGRNGSGKSTLFALITGILDPDAGSVTLAGGKRVIAVAQEVPDCETSCLDFVLDGDGELRELEARLSSERHDEAYFAAQSRYEAIEGFGARARASQLLAGLGFGEADTAKPVRVLSGGWRMRLSLARALMARADLLLLDEPTNHLDLEAIAWLERYLGRYAGALLVVSHDRDFLNAVAQRIAAIEEQVITVYSGSYDDFVARAAQETRQREAAQEAQARRIAELEGFVSRFRAKASKARQAQSRLKVLEKMERVARQRPAPTYRLPLAAPGRAPDPLAIWEDVAFGYPGHEPLFRQVPFRVAPGDRVALIGPNGAGKSSFLKILAGHLSPTAGHCRVSPGVVWGYFAQHQLDQLDPQWHPLDYLTRLAPEAPSQALRDHLGRFGFARQTMDRPVGGFSGGEKSRLVLAGLSWLRPHGLILDEPTNHLDLEMHEALSDALQAYEGALVLVSHDRHLIRACADTLWLLDGRQAREYPGDLDDYQKACAPRTPATRPKPKTRPSSRACQGWRKEQKALEARLEAQEMRLQEIDARLAETEIYRRDAAAVKALQAERIDLAAACREVEERWLALEGHVEAAEGNA